EQGLITTREEMTARTAFIARTKVIAWRSAASIAILAAGLIGGRMSAGMPLRSALAMGVADTSQVGQLAMNADEFQSSASAMQVLQRAQQDYERAALFLANHDTSTSEGATEAYRARLAALDE